MNFKEAAAWLEENREPAWYVVKEYIANLDTAIKSQIEICNDLRGHNAAIEQENARLTAEVRSACQALHDEQNENEKLTAQLAEAQKENQILRQMIWLSHGHAGLYGDDGEMQCNIPPLCDFKRDPIEQIDKHLRERGIAEWTTNQQLESRLDRAEALLRRMKEARPWTLELYDVHRNTADYFREKKS